MPGPSPRRLYAFAESPDTAAYVCSHVLRDGAPVLFVARGEDGHWQFLCGAFHGEGSGEQPFEVCLGDVVEGDRDLQAVAGLPPGASAQRADPQTPWSFHPLEG